MRAFDYREGELYAEAVPATVLAAEHGTPAYVYSRAAIEDRLREYQAALAGTPHLLCYAVKANSNLAVLDLLARAGCGFDIVSGGELARVLAAGARADQVVFAGVGKQRREMHAALDAGIRCFNVESRPELERLDSVAASLATTAPVALRVNPDVDPGTHPYIATGLKESKFGIPIAAAPELAAAAAAMEHVELVGIGAHIGSQLTALGPVEATVRELTRLYDELAPEHPRLAHVDIGGGLGVVYRDENPPAIADYVGCVRAVLGDRPVELLLEPGRSLVAGAGILLTRVEYLKEHEGRRFAIVDAAMNDLLRPALYDAWQNVLPVIPAAGSEAPAVDIVGPVCESADWLARDRPLSVAPGDLLAVTDVGAYGFVMSSNYNSRPRAVEVMVDGDRHHAVRARECVEELWHGESCLPPA